MAFVQLIKITTSRYDELEAAHERWLAATVGKRTVTRVQVARDRDTANVHWLVVEFPDHEAAMRNSDLPETGEIARALNELSEEPLQFVNLDVLRTD